MLTKLLANALPEKPGVYFFKNRRGEILYIGKAKSLRARVRSYTYKSKGHSRRVKRLVRSVAKVDYELCGSELEALLLESRLIKQHKPKYNVMQKKVRNRPFVKINLNADFPRISTVFEIQVDGAKYFGPFRNRAAAEEAVEIIHKLFPLRTCEKSIKPNPNARPCLNYHIGRCLSPCAAKVSAGEYNALLDNVIKLISGAHTQLLDELVQKREQAAAELLFEKAGRIHEQIMLIGKVIERHKFQVNAVDNNDLAVVYPSRDLHAIELFFIKNGKLRAQKRLALAPESELIQQIQPEVIAIFGSSDEPLEITPLDVDAMNIISQWLYANRNSQHIVLWPNHPQWQDASDEFMRRIIQVIFHVVE